MTLFVGVPPTELKPGNCPVTASVAPTNGGANTSVLLRRTVGFDYRGVTRVPRETPWVWRYLNIKPAGNKIRLNP